MQSTQSTFSTTLIRVVGPLAITALTLSACSSVEPEDAANESSESATSSSASSIATEQPSTNLSAQPSEQSSVEGDSTKPFDFELEFEGDFADFVPATEESPATGVPRPIAPEGMNEKTEEGFARFATYYIAERNYAVTSGDTDRWREMASAPGASEAEEELDLIDQVDAAYANGGWVVNGHREIYSGRYLVEESKVADLNFTVYAVENGTTILNPQGNPQRAEWVPVTYEPYLYQLHGIYADGSWYLFSHSGDFEQTLPSE
ncbi:DUF6318 family protein [Rothia nasisuis]|uniref:DUF6318 family protein n=1 Tax=Rothia nasisuis TaxID=2109647 RepID=UPI001F3C0809|nr:DUF6318 family protein [Rothia nasisuis]